MSNERNIEDQFRESAPLWDQQPPESAWDRLSDKLEAGHNARRLRNLRRWGLAASIALISVVFTLWISSGSQEQLDKSRKFGDLASQSSPGESEKSADLNNTGSTKVRGTEKIKTEQTDSIIANDLVLKSKMATSGNFAGRDPDPGLQSRVAEDTAVLDTKLDLFAAGTDTGTAIQYYSNNNGMGVSADSAKWASSLNLEAMSMLNTVGRQDHRSTYTWQADSLQTSRVGSESWLSYENSINQGSQQNSNGIARINAQDNELGYFSLDSASSSDNGIGIQNFNWLLGNWEGDAPTGNSFEEWIQEDEHTITGNGFFHVNGDTLFTEEMKIRQEGESLYLITAVDNSGQPVRFRLRSMVGEAAIFENPSVEFPNEIIVEQHSDSNYSTIMKNGSISNIRSAQRSYLNKRNNIYYNNEVIRNLKRSN